jgi:hypothetical protein
MGDPLSEERYAMNAICEWWFPPEWRWHTGGFDIMKFECRKCKVVFIGEMTFGDLEEIQKMECGGINGGTHKLVGIGGE